MNKFVSGCQESFKIQSAAVWPQTARKQVSCSLSGELRRLSEMSGSKLIRWLKNKHMSLEETEFGREGCPDRLDRVRIRSQHGCFNLNSFTV